MPVCCSRMTWRQMARPRRRFRCWSAPAADRVRSLPRRRPRKLASITRSQVEIEAPGNGCAGCGRGRSFAFATCAACGSSYGARRSAGLAGKPARRVVVDAQLPITGALLSAGEPTLPAAGSRTGSTSMPKHRGCHRWPYQWRVCPARLRPGCRRRSGGDAQITAGVAPGSGRDRRE